MKKYGLEDCKPVCTPMVTRCGLSQDYDSPTIKKYKYRSMIGILIYPTGTRPDIIHAVGIVGRFQENPKETHLKSIKKIFKYIQCTKYLRLWYPKNTYFALHTYTNAD